MKTRKTQLSKIDVVRLRTLKRLKKENTTFFQICILKVGMTEAGTLLTLGFFALCMENRRNTNN